jgi:TolB protein
MRNAFRLLLCLACFSPAFAQRDIGVVDVKGDAQVMGITVTSASPELQNLAMQAFNTHGRYRLLTSGGAYAINFAPAGASAVTVTIARGGSTVHTQTVSGSSQRNALLRAADVAVNRTSGLKGWFAGKIAFVGERTGKTEIYTSDVFFGELVKWTNDGKQVIGPRWSPDGSRIVYTSYRTSFPDIYQIEFASRRISLLASFKGTNSGGRFSPDGARLAMVLSGEGNPEVYVGNAQARQLRRLTRSESVEASPAWSPDGSRLIFASGNPTPQLHVMPAGGGQMTRVNTNISRYCAEPDWSVAAPNKIVFTAAVGRGYQTAVHDLGTGASKIVTQAPTDAVEPVWLADGRHVICTYRAANTRALYVVDTETGKATRLSPAAMGNAGNASYLAP